MTDWEYEVESGGGWEYNDANLQYNSSTDESGDPVFYNTIGTDESWSYQSKS